MTTDITLSTGDQACAIEAIKRTFARRLRCMDTKQWEVYPTLHTDDVVSETWDGLLSLIHISEPTRLSLVSRMPSSA